MYRVIIARDHLGETVKLVRPEEELPGGPGNRYRLAFESDDFAEAVSVLALLRRRVREEHIPVPESVWEELERTAIEQAKRPPTV